MKNATAQSETVLELRDVTKVYPGDVRALQAVSLTLRRGEIYGLVGSNGAGKTTLMRAILGLIHIDTGTGHLLGRPLDARKNSNDIGALIEAPAFHGSMTGLANLRLLAMYWGLTHTDVEVSLDRVGLLENAHRRYRTYSLGMKQRLGIAAAILGSPTLVLLDEPTNGLDPAAIADTRKFLTQLRDEGHTIVLSSHLLSEVEQICDRIGILDHGRLIAEGTVSELRSLAKTPGTRLRIVAEPFAQALATVSAIAPAARIIVEPGKNLIEVHLAGVAGNEVNRALLDAGVTVRSFAEVNNSLEETFLSILHHDDSITTGGHPR